MKEAMVAGRSRQPSHDLAETPGEDLKHGVEARGEDRAMLLHVRVDPLRTLQQPEVTQLVELVRPDALRGTAGTVPRDVVDGGAEEGDPAPADLGGRGEDEGPVGVAGLSGEAKHGDDGGERRGEHMHGVGVVP